MRYDKQSLEKRDFHEVQYKDPAGQMFCYKAMQHTEVLIQMVLLHQGAKKPCMLSEHVHFAQAWHHAMPRPAVTGSNDCCSPLGCHAESAPTADAVPMRPRIPVQEQAPVIAALAACLLHEWWTLEGFLQPAPWVPTAAAVAAAAAPKHYNWREAAT